LTTARDRRLAALAVAFAKGRAPALLSRLSGPRAVAAAESAGRLEAAPRHDRLAALAAAMSRDPGPPLASSEAGATLERPRVAAVMRAIASGAPPPGASAPLVRLCRERLGG
jgi:hypothetical protein